MSRKVSQKKLTATKKPARKRGSGSNPASRAGDANLNRNGRLPKNSPNSLPAPYPSHWEDFIIEYKLRGGIRRAAAECRMSTSTAVAILRDDRTAAIMQKIDAAILDKKIAMAAEEFVATKSDISEILYDIAKFGKTHDYRGDRDRVDAALGLGEIEGLIQRKNVTINQANAQALGAIQGTGQDAFQVFEAGWLTERKEQWGNELTQKVRHYLETSLPSDLSPHAAKGE